MGHFHSNTLKHFFIKAFPFTKYIEMRQELTLCALRVMSRANYFFFLRIEAFCLKKTMILRRGIESKAII